MLWSDRDHNILLGGLLWFLCWLYVILIPLGLPLALHLFSWVVAVPVEIILCLFPALLCKLRYTSGRRSVLLEHYGKMKHPGRKLVQIAIVAIALTVVNVALMFHLGFIHF